MNTQLNSQQYFEMQKGNGKTIYNWIIRNLPPLSWNILAVKAGNEFLSHGIDPFNISEETVFKPDLISEINFFLRSYYNKELPW